jgi:hypothetical protein
MPSIVTENNRVKCVFWGEKDSIFALELLCIKGGNTQDVHQARHFRNGAIFKRNSLYQTLYLVVASRASEVKITCHNVESCQIADYNW